MVKQKKIKMRKETRDEAARRKLKEKVQKREIAYGMNLRLANKKVEYITNLINGRYYMARCNMIAEQLNDRDIKESIDGCLKSEEYIRSEYALMKLQAIKSMRTTHFSKQELLKEFNLKEEDILALEKDYYDGKIIREAYDGSYKKGNKAEFVNSSKD